MNSRHLIASLLAVGVTATVCVGCGTAPGYPKKNEEVQRPEQVLDFHTLYQSNCAGCHGDAGRNGAALPLNNPSYLAVANVDALRTSIAKGVEGTLMPPFAKSSGGMLTDQQVESIALGILHNWSQPAQFTGVALPTYSDGQPGDIAKGQKLFVAACARCHGIDGMGLKSGDKTSIANGGAVADPDYLALISDQTLRSFVIGGRPDEGMPDWRKDLPGTQGRALTSSEITDIVAWVASHRVQATKPSPQTHP